MNNRLGIILTFLFAPFFSFAQWNPAGATESTPITRSGNIEVGTLVLGRYGSSFFGDPNPYNIYSNATAPKELLIYGNGAAGTLSFRMYDGNIKLGDIQGSPNATLFNDGSASFKNWASVTGTKILPTSSLHTDATNYTNNYTFKLRSSNNALYFSTSTAGNDRRFFIQAGHDDPNYSYGLGTITLNPFGGNVGIGTGPTAPTAALQVNGIVHAEEVKVDLTVPGPDYVFQDDYKLRTLVEVQRYIDENGHLPEVPSAKVMEENGINLSEMNMLLLKKVEELTLYIIELEKQNSLSRAEFEKRIQSLENGR